MYIYMHMIWYGLSFFRSFQFMTTTRFPVPSLATFVSDLPSCEASDLELYSSDIDFSSLYPKHLGILLRSGNLRYQDPEKKGIRISSD